MRIDGGVRTAATACDCGTRRVRLVGRYTGWSKRCVGCDKARDWLDGAVKVACKGCGGTEGRRYTGSGIGAFTLCQRCGKVATAGGAA